MYYLLYYGILVVSLASKFLNVETFAFVAYIRILSLIIEDFVYEAFFPTIYEALFVGVKDVNQSS